MHMFTLPYKRLCTTLQPRARIYNAACMCLQLSMYVITTPVYVITMRMYVLVDRDAQSVPAVRPE